LSFIFVKIEALKALIHKYRAVLRFILVFFGSYALMAAAYGLYLHIYLPETGTPDPITKLVAQQSADLIESIGYRVGTVPNDRKPAVLLSLNGNYMVNIIEGCNSVSVIILFIAFVLAFANGFWRTSIFLFAGGCLIYAVNIVRIALLAVAMYKFPEWNEFLHGVLFPLIIYGLVFMLWVFWTRSLLKPRIE